MQNNSSTNASALKSKHTLCLKKREKLGKSQDGAKSTSTHFKQHLFNKHAVSEI